MASAEPGDGRRRRPEHVDAVGAGRGAAQTPRRLVHGAFVAPGDDERHQPAEGRHAGPFADRGFRVEKTVAVPRHQRRHHRVLGHVGLHQHPARPLRAPGAARHLVEKRIHPLRRPQVAAAQSQVPVDHPDQGEQGKVVALGHDLGADHQVDVVVFDAAYQVRRRARAGDGVAGGDGVADAGEQGVDLLGQALDAGAAGGEALFGLA